MTNRSPYKLKELDPKRMSLYSFAKNPQNRLKESHLHPDDNSRLLKPGN